MNKTIWMSMATVGISLAFVAAGMGQQAPAGSQGPGAARTPAAIHGVTPAKTAPDGAKPMILAQGKEGKKENPPATSGSAPGKEVKKEGASAPQGQGKEVKKETPPASKPAAKEGKTTEKK